jgi:hypothetical protein
MAEREIERRWGGQMKLLEIEWEREGYWKVG